MVDDELAEAARAFIAARDTYLKQGKYVEVLRKNPTYYADVLDECIDVLMSAGKAADAARHALVEAARKWSVRPEPRDAR